MTKDRICATATGLPKITRRTLMASVPVIAAGTLPSLASAPKGAANLFLHWLAEVDYVNALGTPTDEALDIACGPMDDLDRRIMDAPIRTVEDLAVKVVVATHFGTYDCLTPMREAASMLGQSHRIPRCLAAAS